MKLLLLAALMLPLCRGGEFLVGHDKSDITVKWIANYKEQRVYFTVSFSQTPPTMLVLGFSDHGQFNHSDVVVWKNNKIYDSYISQYFDIETDMRQDWRTDSITEKAFIISRSFVTCDPLDYAFMTGTTQFILGVTWKGEVRNINDRRIITDTLFAKVLGEEEKKEKIEDDVYSFEVLAKDAQIPAETTTYWCVIQELPQTIQRTKHHIVQLEAAVQLGNDHLVHHMEVFLCQEDVKGFSGNCNDPMKPRKSKSCGHVIAAWAMGEGPITYPPEAGLPVGGPEAKRFVMVEIHYNNPMKMANVRDNSGFKLTVTPTLREHDAAIMELGLIYSDANSIPPGQKAFAINAFCTQECTSYLPSTGIHVFASQLHAHLTGAKIWTSHYRNGVKIGELNRDEHYSPHWQHVQSVVPYAHILPKDTLTTTCVYDTSKRARTTLGGYGIEDEMCVNYIYYYPASKIEVCKSAIDNSTLRQFFRTRYGITDVTMPISDMYDIVNWNQHKAKEFSDLFHVAPLNMACLKQDSTTFHSRKWQNVPQPTHYSGAYIKTRDVYECPSIND